MTDAVRLLFMFVLTALMMPSLALGGIMQYITFRGSSSGDLDAQPGKTLELHIDESIDVVWDLEAFLVELADTQGIVEHGDPLLTRIEALRTSVTAFLATQESQIALKEVAIRLEEAKAIGDTDREAELRQELHAVANRYSDRGLRSFDTLEQLDAELYAELEQALESATLEDDYLPLAKVLRQKLRDLGDELARRIDSGLDVKIYMRAYHVAHIGSRTPVHLDGYDSAAVGDPMPFPRNQTAVDERTMAELEAADGITDVVKDLLDGTFRSEMRTSLGQLRTSLRNLGNKVHTNVLDAQLQALIEDLENANDESLRPLIRTARNVRASLKSLSDIPELEATADAEKLAEIFHLVLAAKNRLWSALNELPNALVNLCNELFTLAQTRAQLIREQTLATLEEAKEDFLAQQQYLTSLYATLQEIAGTLGLSQDVVAEVEQLPRRIGAGVSLDTHLELQTIPKERHPGDRLVVRVEVAVDDHADISRILARGQQTFCMEFYGVYREIRGALLFVDPRSPISRDLSFEPVPALAVQWRLGLKNKPWWNRGLSPGFGISLSILDFEDESGFELGVAANLSILAELIWVGYGRNLQAEADFFYVGVNPVALTGLMRRRGG